MAKLDIRNLLHWALGQGHACEITCALWLLSTPHCLHSITPQLLAFTLVKGISQYHPPQLDNKVMLFCFLSKAMPLARWVRDGLLECSALVFFLPLPPLTELSPSLQVSPVLSACSEYFAPAT